MMNDSLLKDSDLFDRVYADGRADGYREGLAAARREPSRAPTLATVASVFLAAVAVGRGIVTGRR